MSKKSWFNLVRRFFLLDKQSKNEKKEKRRRWLFFGRFKIKSRLAAIEAPSSSPPRERTALIDAEEELNKRALSVALASAAAAEAAVKAAQVVFLTGVPKAIDQYCHETAVSAIIKQPPGSSYTQIYQTEIQELAALRIQTAFRGYLARKALRALKGIVTLQAIIRGRNVRRQAISTLKCLQSIINIQSQTCARRNQPFQGTCQWDEKEDLHNLKDKIIKMDMNSQKRWDGSILTKEEADATFLSRREAATKRERIREYAFGHRKSAETERNKVNGRWKYWLEQWVDTQIAKSRELEDLDSVLTSDAKPRVEYRGKQLKLRGLSRQHHFEGLDSPMAAPRRSFHRTQSSLGEDNCFSRSPLIPTYMAATESAKAKARSMSSPKLRAGGFDAYSDSYSPSKNRVHLTPSRTSEVARNGRFGKLSAYQQRSPSLKGVHCPIRSSRTLKDLSFNSDYSFRTWDNHSEFRS
ncbi:hypothetical protein K2173_024803 [Erythroxylum novogranatense]|uniref:DUF4005 domain-containing protein n=1 Tax=Erythroxylum novogranatense TaxID=1862640 RepID=A0AAV8UF43_9ROSI|nr:hypothetical protein K2173_024803 [Erythroxylum novogranatense]